ncbi:hormogonium polysaccharide biosynthesis protein HpsA [Microcoleus sp. C2C3]|uniref:hormogonium polysaccharide biosynthesis protein HpsA n=1 Tax=unclassified Microcoleus TaxID=2642155 RepID=UPI002FD6DC2F
MFKSKLSKVIVSLLRRVLGVTRSGAKRLMRAMLRSLMAMGRRARLPVAGFVLPTVTMVLLVVILLTVAITLRSFDRGNIARNVRVNQQVLAAATPALDRAKAKIQFLLYEDPQKPTATPSDENLYNRLANVTGGTDLYTFGGEERLILRASLSDTPGTPNPAADPRNPIFDPATNLENEAINTAWRYPVDTDKDGIFDTFTLYGIFSRTPARSNVAPNVGDFTRPRRPIEARTPPMSSGNAAPSCARGGGTVANLVGNLGWYKTDDGLLKKSFFVYTVNVPITPAEAGTLGANYQAFKGTTSISALEYQQDQSRIPLANNAAVYEDDMDISPGPPLNLNGGIFTNSNLLVSGVNTPNSIQLYQISSPDSCFYAQENSKIKVGGNVVSGWSGSTVPTNPVGVHLFETKATLGGSGGRTQAMLSRAQTISPTNQSATGNNSLQVLYNNAAYTARLSMLVAARRGANPPAEDVETVAADDPFSVRNKPDTQTRKQALEEHFKQTLRKVPFAEVGLTDNPTKDYSLPWAPPLPPEQPGGWPLEGEGTDDLRPPDAWSLPDPADTKIQLTTNQLEATDPSEKLEKEERLGDRVVAGNNLPALRWDAGDGKLVSKPQEIQGATWTGSSTQRTRSPQVTKLADVGATDRSGFWEGEAARVPVNPLAATGGLRVITGAGVYERINSFLPPPTWQDPLTGATKGTIATDRYDDPTTNAVIETYPVVWPDTMPMSPLGPGSRVYNNNIASGALEWKTWPGAGLPMVPLPPGGLTPTGLAVALGSAIDPTTPQYAKGDLRMRATVVYHYDNGVAPGGAGTFNETPLACISSYYDPSTASTARNLNLGGLPDVSGDLSLGTRGTQVGSNNGVVYGVNGIVAGRVIGPLTPDPVNGLFSGGTPLEQQANLVFPDGRFVNPLLREALAAPDPANRSLAQTAAIDSTNCAIQILAGTAGAGAGIPDGAIKEVAFLNGREIKAIDRDDWQTPNVNEAFTLSSPLVAIPPAEPANLTGNYNLPLEEREPLEIRATQIDLNQLRSTQIGAGEYLLPNSGIIYASRDDALPDRSARIPGAGGTSIDEARSASVSPTDSRLDPTRKPNGILLVNGQQLARIPGIGTNPSVLDVVREKGLTLASNLPVYIQGNFNLHTQEEFNQTLDWASFYDRKDLNPNFACRQNDPRVTGCTTGDDWRPANVLSDAVTLLSANYRFGFRNEGDFDLRNNAGAAAVLPRQQQGFYSNNFVTNGLSSGAFSATGGIAANPPDFLDLNYANNNALRSSYFNNFVTPVQRRGQFAEYVMEVCTKLPVSACTDDDWYVDPADTRKATVGDSVTIADYPAGTTAIPPTPELQRFPRRVAFDRNAVSPFALRNSVAPEPLGVNAATNQVIVVNGAGQTRTTSTNSLWFATTAASGGNAVTYGAGDFPYVFNRSRIDSTGQLVPVLGASSTPPNTAQASITASQPLLIPVSQTQTVGPAGPAPNPPGGVIVQQTGWIPSAVATTFNLIVGSNDTPSRALGNNVGDFNGGLQNLPRFLESWNTIATNIQGSFIQFNRSAYSTAPYLPILDPAAPQQTAPDTTLLSLFAQPQLTTQPPLQPPLPVPFLLTNPPEAGYRTSTGSIPGSSTNLGRIPFFTPPVRNWGYDVGLVSQSPDLFTQRFTTPPAKSTPDEFFREVPRNDLWVETLMCAELAPATGTSGSPAIPVTNPNRPPLCPPNL